MYFFGGYVCHDLGRVVMSFWSTNAPRPLSQSVSTNVYSLFRKEFLEVGKPIVKDSLL